MQPRILSTLHPWSDIPEWGSRVHSIRLGADQSAQAGVLGTLARELYRGARLWWVSRRYDAVITDSSPHVAVFGLLERLRPNSGRRHLLFECLWCHVPGRLARAAKTAQLRATLTPRSRAIVYARRERESFSRYFGLPRERFVFIPYHTTLRRFDASRHSRPLREPYVFAGGDTHRDYRTLCDAVAGLEVRVIIALRDRRLLDGVAVPQNVTVLTTDHTEFRRWMLHACINVVPLEAGTLRSAGQQTFLNAMALGTPVIVTDVEGGSDYIRNWYDGVLVEPGDPSGLRAALVRLLEDPELAAAISANAVQVALRYDTERILGLCLDYLVSDRFHDASCGSYLGEPEPHADCCL